MNICKEDGSFKASPAFVTNLIIKPLRGSFLAIVYHKCDLIKMFGRILKIFRLRNEMRRELRGGLLMGLNYIQCTFRQSIFVIINLKVSEILVS